MSEQNKRYRFGNFEINVATREIKENGQLLNVQPLVFDFLVLLIENRGTVLETQVILKQIWQDTIVTDESLRLCATKARKILHDSASSQRWIKSDSYGYQFIGKVRQVSPCNPSRSHLMLWISGICLILATLALLMLPERQLLKSANTSDTLHLGVAVLPIIIADEDSSDNSWIELGLMGLLNRKLQQLPWLTVTSEKTVLALTEVHANWRNVESDFDGIVKGLSTTQKAQYLLMTELSNAENNYELNYKVYSNGAIIDSGYYTSHHPAQLVTALFEKFVLLVTGQLPFEGAALFDVDNKVMGDAYLKALSLQIQGKSEEAAVHFQAITEKYPDLFWPKYEYASALRRIGELARARIVFDELRKENLPVRQMLWTLLGAGTVADIQRRLNEAENLYLSGWKLVENTEFIPEQIAASINLGIIYTNQARFEEAQKVLLRAADLAARYNENTHLTSIHTTLGIVFQSLGEHQKAIDHYSNGVEYARLVHDRRRESIASNNLGIMYFGMGELENAEVQFTKALLLRQNLGYKPGILSSGSVLGHLYLKLGQYTTAREKLSMAAKISIELENPRLYWQISVLTRLSEVEALLGDFEQAKALLQQANNIVENASVSDAVLEQKYNVNLAEARFEMVVGNFAQAYDIAMQVYEAVTQNSQEGFAERARVVEFTAMEILCELTFKSSTQIGNLNYCRRMLDESDESVLPYEKGSRMLLLVRALLGKGQLHEAISVMSGIPDNFAKRYEYLVVQAHIAHIQERDQQAATYKNLALENAGERTNPEQDFVF